MEPTNLTSDGNAPLIPLISFRLDARSGIPTYLQLVHQVEGALRLGALSQGDRLPKVKDVVAELSINPNTVLKAYRELEARGVARGRQGVGTFVIAELPVISAEVFEGLRATLVNGWLQEARNAGLSDADATALFMSAVSAGSSDISSDRVAQ
jgi:GntR family transcriptional regulator